MSTTTVHGKAQLKTFDELTPEQQKVALEFWTNKVLHRIMEGYMAEEWFGDNEYAKMVAAMEEAHRMRTPWFTGEYLMDAAGEAIRTTAIGHAVGVGVLYNTDNVYIVEI